MRKLGILYAPRDSASAAALCRAVPLYRYGPDGFRSVGGVRAAARGLPWVNWGCSKWPAGWNMDGEMEDVPCLNMNHHGVPVATALSKLKTLTILKEAGVPCLEATGDVSTAKLWAEQGLVLARKDGLSGGRGIQLIKDWSEQAMQNDWPATDMYVRYWKKTHEYRVHVFRHAEGDGWQGPSTPLPSHYVIDIQQKRRRTEWQGNYDPMIRNFDNGWVFCHDNIKGTETEITAIGQTATMAVTATGLDFGAVDILARFNDAGILKKHVVCEINTAPGLEGQTLEKYTTAIRNYLTQEG